MITPQADRPTRPLASPVPQPTSRERPQEPGGQGWLLLLLAPLLCCGGPLLITAAATLGGAAWGAIGAIVALATAVGLVLLRRRSRRCCAPGVGSGRSARRVGDDVTVSR